MENLLEGRLLGLHEEIDLVAGTRYAYIGVGIPAGAMRSVPTVADAGR